MARKNGRSRSASNTGALTLPLAAVTDSHLDIGMLETWLWDAACVIRGATDAPKFKDFILPLVFYKRLSDVFDDEFAKQTERYEDENLAWEIVQEDHEAALAGGRTAIIRFFIPRECRWDALRNHPADNYLGEFVTDAMRAVAQQNPDLQGRPRCARLQRATERPAHA